MALKAVYRSELQPEGWESPTGWAPRRALPSPHPQVASLGGRWRAVPHAALPPVPPGACDVLTRNWEAANRHRLLLTVREWLQVPGGGGF